MIVCQFAHVSGFCHCVCLMICPTTWHNHIDLSIPFSCIMQLSSLLTKVQVCVSRHYWWEEWSRGADWQPMCLGYRPRWLCLKYLWKSTPFCYCTGLCILLWIASVFSCMIFLKLNLYRKNDIAIKTNRLCLWHQNSSGQVQITMSILVMHDESNGLPNNYISRS